MDQSMLSLDNKVDSKTKGVCIRLFLSFGQFSEQTHLSNTVATQTLNDSSET